MAIVRPEACRRRSLQARSEAEDGTRRGFLASRGMGVSPGEESCGSSVAAQAIEAQPSRGQIKPLERPHWAWGYSIHPETWPARRDAAKSGGSRVAERQAPACKTVGVRPEPPRPTAPFAFV